jgi:hypothetical protein
MFYNIDARRIAMMGIPVEDSTLKKKGRKTR